MPTCVRINDIVDGMEMQSDDMHSFLHRPSGRVITISDDALAAADRDDDDWVSPEELADARQILETEGEYLPLPDRFDIDEYRMMERFARSLSEPAAREAALTAIHGRGAFRYFKDTVHRLNLAPSWYAYRDECYRDVARAWCDTQGLEYEDSARHADA